MATIKQKAIFDERLQPMDLIDRVTVIAIGVGNYTYLQRLQGPESDISRLRVLLNKDAATAIVPDSRFIELIDKESSQVRQAITKYALGRSAPHDVLVLYFSGHSIPMGQSDLGLCMKDTRVHSEFNVPIPMNLIRFADIVETLATVKVDPVIILDTCFSGQAGAKIEHVELKRTIQAETGSTYALLCSSTKLETTPDQSTGGPFSLFLDKVARRGLGGVEHRRKPVLTLKDLFPELRREVEASFETVPQLFLGDTLPEFGFVRNILYRPRCETLTHGHVIALAAFWNNGSPRTLSTKDLQKLGSTVHTTYSKLGYEPAWSLIESVDRRTRRLSSRGVQFMRDELSIPHTIQKDPVNDNWETAPDCQWVKISDLCSAGS